MQKENLSLLFSTPLWTYKINDLETTNKKLTQAIFSEKASDAGVALSNQGGWQSSGALQIKPEFQILVDIINTYLEKVGHDYGFGDASSNLKITSMWANINPKGCSNAIHSHQSPSGMPNPLVISGCYYVKVPSNSGQFVLQDFARPMRYLMLPFQEPNLTNSFTIKLSPQEGNLFFFPAWVEHSVDENMSDEDRISIAFNVAILNRPMQKGK